MSKAGRLIGVINLVLPPSSPLVGVTSTGTGRHLFGRWENKDNELFMDIFPAFS